jgi:uncharacterized membrane protein
LIHKNKYFNITILLILAFVYYLFVILFLYNKFKLGGDFALFETILYNSINGKFLIEPSGRIFFSQHFSPIIIILIPVYWAFQSPYTLMVVYASLTTIAIIPIYLISEKFFSNKIVTITLYLSYIFSPGIYSGYQSAFKPDVFYPFLVLMLLWYSINKKWKYYYIFFSLVLFVKEDSAIALAGFGMFMVFTGEKKHGFFTFFLSVIYLFTVLLVFLPLFRSIDNIKTMYFLERWSDYGNTLPEIAVNFLNLKKNIEVIFVHEKIIPLIITLMYFLLLPVINWKTLLCLVLPLVFLNLSSNKEDMFEIKTQYFLLLYPFLFYSMIFNIKKLTAKLSAFKSKYSYRIQYIFAALLFLVSIRALENTGRLKQFSPEYWKIESRNKTALNFITSIPDNSSASVQGNLLARVPVTINKDFIPNNIQNSDYLLFDLKGWTHPLTNEENYKLMDSLKNNQLWIVLNDKDDFVFMKRK